MGSWIVKIGRLEKLKARPLDILAAPEAAPFMGNAFLPATAVIPLRQHSGDTARPVILPGMPVREGQIIAAPHGENSAYVYSSIPGILREYRDVPLCSGKKEKSAIIELSGAFELSGRRPEPRDLEGASPEWLLSMIESLGVLRTFDGVCAPLASSLRSFRRKLSSDEGQGENQEPRGILALRMHDYDPSCRVDSLLAETYAASVLEGAILAAKILEVKRIFILYPSKKALASSSLDDALFEGVDAKRAAVSPVYPSGSDYFCKSEAASAFEDTNINEVFCINAWTALCVFNALKYARPVLQRPVLIAGPAVMEPRILNVRIGTKIRDVVAECGGFKFPPVMAIAGGMLAGKAINDLETPVDMSTDALHFFGKRERSLFTAERCIHCGRCMRICPLGLDPIRLALAEQEGNGGLAAPKEGKTAKNCIFCGTCTASCPAGIPLHHIICNAIDRDVFSSRKGGGI